MRIIAVAALRDFWMRPGRGDAEQPLRAWVHIVRGAQVLRPETVAVMSQNHIGALEIPVFRTAAPSLSNDVELFPGMSKKWGLSFLINTQPPPTGRSAGSLAWAGLANAYFWSDPTKRVSGVFLSQVFPFYDGTAIELLGKFETEVYRAL